MYHIMQVKLIDKILYIGLQCTNFKNDNCRLSLGLAFAAYSMPGRQTFQVKVVRQIQPDLSWKSDMFTEIHDNTC